MDNAQEYKSIPHTINIKPLKIYLLFLIIMCPIFVNLDISQGLRFDISVLNRLELKKPPSLPLSSFVVLFLIFFNFRVLLKKKFNFIFSGYVDY